MNKNKRYSLDAKDLLTKSEIYEIKAGENVKGDKGEDITIDICHTGCALYAKNYIYFPCE